MTREMLYSELDKFISNGYLENYYSNDKFSIFNFLNMIYVGFIHTEEVNSKKESDGVIGFLLTKAEADVIVASASYEAMKYINSFENACFVFSRKVFSKCKSRIGQLFLSQELKKRYYQQGNISEVDYQLVGKINEDAGLQIIKSELNAKEEGISCCRRYSKIVKILGSIAIVSVLLALVALVTSDWRSKYNKDIDSEPFNKNSSVDTYSYLEIDILVPFAEVEVEDPSQVNENLCGTYFLYGNLESKDYGIVKFADSYEESRIFSDEFSPKVLDETICLYGETVEIPSLITDLLNKKQPVSEDDNDFENIVILPEVSAPFVADVTDLSSKAITFLSEKGILIDSDIELGTRYVKSTIEPKKVISPINKIIKKLTLAFVCLAIVLFVPIVIFAGKADKNMEGIVLANKGMIILNLLE